MEKVKRIFETKYLVAIIISLILGSSLFGYGYMDFKYKTKVLEAKKQIETKTEERRNQLHACMGEAESNYYKNWDSMCRVLGRASGCDLPPAYSDKITEERNGTREGCNNLFN